ncbi:hypothetical protein NZ698_06785 [Chryseobacterium sp. PBS4-4]|uniref:SD-repeat containing protein B domain-containing protein n=1 Tax=Chryseobacterium edaphi TaxID=2976532 RepID=A0ABT2W3W3_9FLAO|nr:hypothetical protein [Chryseobacterium edaphi]MCU7616897.1 hypothetical protein [Chryseobacterium edaphi]
MICSLFLSAQNKTENILFDIHEKSYNAESKILDMVIIVDNSKNENFKGKLKISTPTGFKSILGQEIAIDLQKNEKRFISLKFFVGNNADAGDAQINLILANEFDQKIGEKTVIHQVEESNLLQMMAESPQIFRSNDLDSLKIRIKVSNKGNRMQQTTLVFKIPDYSDSNHFIEQHGTLRPQQDSTFTFSFLPSKELLKHNNFTINVTGFKDPDKEIFGNTRISVQSISHTQKFQDEQQNGFASTTRNSITASYRRVGNDLDMYQILGSGGFNVASGYVFINGNMFLMNSQNDPVINNTYISYRREKSEFTLGNISKLLELSLFGRGIEYSFLNAAKDKKLEVGFIEQSFSLLERNSFFKNGYGFYVKGILNPYNFSHNISSIYIFKNDPYEKAKHHLVGTEFTHNFNNLWQTSSKLYGGISVYDRNGITKPSLAFESQYSGIFKKLNLNGNIFYSSDYYPGNRRGSVQIQQNINLIAFKKHYAFANIFYSNYSPKYYFYQTQLSSDNVKMEAGLNLAKTGSFGYSFAYQYQFEKSNSYNNFLPQFQKNALSIQANRIVESTNWTSINKKHSAVLALELGFAQYPNDENQQFQGKINFSYNYMRINFTSQYQIGSYYLSEYAFSQLADKNKKFTKLNTSVYYSSNAFKDKLSLTSGLSYTDDNIYGKSPSAFCNLKWHTRMYDFFVNSSLYNYSSANMRNNIFTIEAGVTLNLQKATLSTKKKSDVHAFAFYDKNNNNIFDTDEETASDYLININNIAFKTDPEGKILYKNVPFGKYRLKQAIQEGWYYDDQMLDINQYKLEIAIPLHQNGTVAGHINYEFDKKTAVDFTPRANGITFNIFRDNVLIETATSDDNGEFISFLPIGNYTILLNANSLPQNTYCDTERFTFSVKAGELFTLPEFVIKVKEKKIHSKKFGN